MVRKDLKHQLYSCTATGGFHILNFHLRLLQACSQGLNTFKNIKPPELLRPECLHHGLLQPFPDTAGVHQHSSTRSLWLFSFCPEGLQQASSLWMLTGLSAASSSRAMLTYGVRVPGTATAHLRVTWQPHFHDYLKTQDNLMLKKRLGYLGIAPVELVVPSKKCFGFQLGISWRQ